MIPATLPVPKTLCAPWICHRTWFMYRKITLPWRVHMQKAARPSSSDPEPVPKQMVACGILSGPQSCQLLCLLGLATLPERESECFNSCLKLCDEIIRRRRRTPMFWLHKAKHKYFYDDLDTGHSRKINSSDKKFFVRAASNNVVSICACWH